MSKCAVAKLTVAMIQQGIEVDIDGTISAVTCECALTVGMVISNVNAAAVSNRSELKAELAKFAPGEVMALKACVNVSGQVESLGGTEQKEPEEGDITVAGGARPSKDEFDMDSDDEGKDVKAPKLPPRGETVAVEVSEPAIEMFVKTAQKCRPGACILLFCEAYNPAMHMEAAATRFGSFAMFIDATQRMKIKQRIDDIGGIISKSLAKGAWVFVENATKSITLLEKIAECIEESNQIHVNSRLFLMCEPHPHFPAKLVSNSVILHVKQPSGVVALEMNCDDLSESRKLTTTRGLTSATSAPPTVQGSKKKVRINQQVDVVQIEGNAFLELSASAVPHGGDQPGEAASSPLRRVARYRLGASEKLISLCQVEPNRFAVGSSGGYVSVLDRNALPLVQFRPHKACLWDIKFASQNDFSTACEDGSSSIYRFNVAEQELETLSVASFESDVFAVAYAKPTDPTGPVLSGGLSGTVCVLHVDRGNCTFIPWTTSIQAMASFPMRNQVVIGGGDGMCAAIDVTTLKIVESTNRHTKKVPAINSCGNSLVTGGFDKSLRLWDMRKSMQCTHNLVMHDVVTAVAVSETYVVACSGSSLCLWDNRNLHQLLAIKTKAWNGLTRGLVLDESAKLAVTASVDGFARFWEIS